MLVHVRRGRMRVRCENVSLPLSLKKLRVREASDPEAYVNFSASGMPLVRLAELFDDLFRARS